MACFGIEIQLPSYHCTVDPEGLVFEVLQVPLRARKIIEDRHSLALIYFTGMRTSTNKIS